MALVAARHAAESAMFAAGIGQRPGDHDEALVDLAAAEGVVFAGRDILVGGGGAVIGVQTAVSHALAHDHAVEPIEAESIAQAQAQHGHDGGVIEQVAEGLAQLRKPAPTGLGLRSRVMLSGTVLSGLSREAPRVGALPKRGESSGGGRFCWSMRRLSSATSAGLRASSMTR